MKKLTSMAMAFALAGFAGSALAGTATDNIWAGALHSSMTVHFNGLVEQPTCSFRGKSMKVTLPAISTDSLKNLSQGQTTEQGQKDFILWMSCSGKRTSETAHLRSHGDRDNKYRNILKNTHGSAKGAGLEIFNQYDKSLPLDVDLSNVAGIKNAFESTDEGGHSIAFKAKYARADGDLSAGTLATDAVFEISYQ